MKTSVALSVSLLLAFILNMPFAPAQDNSSGTTKTTGVVTGKPEKTGTETATGSALPEKTGTDNSSSVKAKTVRSPFTVGEKLHYTVTFSGIPAGTSVISTLPMVDFKGNKSYRVRVSTRSYKAFDLIYSVKDDIESIFDETTFTPYFFRKMLNEGKRQQEEYISFDHIKHEAIFRKKKNDGKGWKKSKPVKIAAGTHDPLTSLLILRTMDFKVGDTIKIPVFTRRKSWDLVIHVKKKEVKRIRGVGKWLCYHLIPEYKFDGIFIKSGHADIWVEAETKIPIIMEVTLPIGFAEIRLEKVEMPEEKPKEESKPVDNSKNGEAKKEK